MQVAPPEVVQRRQEQFDAWAARVARPRPLGHRFTYTPARPLHWTPLKRPLAACTVALVSTAGVHLKDDEPFAVFDEQGDWTLRRIPGDARTSDLTVTHTHYDTRDAEQDINVVFPLDRLHELASDGVIGRVSPLHFGFMGFIPDPAALVRDTAPQAARELAATGVDAALLTAG